MPNDSGDIDDSTSKDIFQQYLEYTKDTESPRVFHRWCLLSAVGSLLGRRCYFSHGHSRIYPNLYLMLLGEAGARKSTAVKLIKRLAGQSGYDKFAANKSSLEQFLVDLEGYIKDADDPRAGKGGTTRGLDSATYRDLWGIDDPASLVPKETWIVADEFNEFAGPSNLNFYSTLGDLFDYDNEEQPYEYRLKNSRSVSIYQPTVSILGGNTSENFARAFPPDIIGQGFFSRILLIFSEPSGRRITIPPPPDPITTSRIIKSFKVLSTFSPGQVGISSEASRILDRIYTAFDGVDDSRFRSYNSRRCFPHLIKLALGLCAVRHGDRITEEDLITANTYLSAAEVMMPTALGEFGRSKNSDVAQQILTFLGNAKKPMSIKDIWGVVHKDVDNLHALGPLMEGLQKAEKIQYITGMGFLAKHKAKIKPDFVDWSLLTEEERLVVE